VENLDGLAIHRPSPTDGKSNNAHTLDALPTDSCVSSLHRLGFSMGKTKQETTLAIKALKRIDIDRTRVETKRSAPKKPICSDSNTFDLSDDEDTRPDSSLLTHFV
jgi:hypothetical protein